MEARRFIEGELSNIGVHSLSNKLNQCTSPIISIAGSLSGGYFLLYTLYFIRRMRNTPIRNTMQATPWRKDRTMQRPLDNQHVIEIKPLPSPRTIKSTLPITDQAAALVVETRDAIRRILHGQDRERLLVIVGPCSIHDPEAAYEYADRLKPVADALRDRLLIVMRTYFEKPRTTDWVERPHQRSASGRHLRYRNRNGARENDPPEHQQARGPLRG